MLLCPALFVCKGGDLMKKRKNSFLVWLLAAVLAVGMMPASALPSFAVETAYVKTVAELKAALESEGDKSVYLIADVVCDLNKHIEVKGNKTLQLHGHKIMLKSSYFYVPTGADFKVKDSQGVGEIKSTDVMIFAMDGGSLTIEGGRYIVRENLANVVWVSNNAAGGEIKINGGYFQSIRGNVIYSVSKQDLDPPEIVINGGTFISDESSVWTSTDKDETKGTVNGGSFHGAGGAFDIPFVNILISGNKFVGAGKYLVEDGVHIDNPTLLLWQLKGKFIQVGNNADDFVNVTMNAAAGGKGYFFKGGWKETTVLAMKNNILPVVAVPEAGNILSAWEKVSGDGSFEDPSLVRAYYIPKAASGVKPNFAAAPPKPTLGIVGTYTYNGTEQTAEVTGYDPATMRIEGNKRINAGTHEISVYPKGLKWEDGTEEPAKVDWTIEKASCTGEPTCTKITEAGKTLADVALNINRRPDRKSVV